MRTRSESAAWAAIVLWLGACGSDGKDGTADKGPGARGDGGASLGADAAAGRAPALTPSLEALIAGDSLAIVAESAVNADSGVVQKGLASCAQIRPQADLTIRIALDACTGPSGLFQFSGELFLKRDRTQAAFSVWTGAPGLTYAADQAALDAALAEASGELGLTIPRDLVRYEGALRIAEGTPAFASVEPSAAVSVWGEAKLGADGEPATVVTVADAGRLVWDLAAAERCACPTDGSARLQNSSKWEGHALLLAFEPACGSAQASVEGFDERCGEALAALPEEAVAACGAAPGESTTKQRRSCTEDADCARGQSCQDGSCAVNVASDGGLSLPDAPDNPGDTPQLSGCAEQCADVATIESLLATQCAEADGSRFAELIDAGVLP